MKSTPLPVPPNPDDAKYKGNSLAHARDMYRWATKTKGVVDNMMNVNNAPAGQQVAVGSFTTNTTISGTSTGTDVANFVSSLVTALTKKGILSPTVTIGDTQ